MCRWSTWGVIAPPWQWFVRPFALYYFEQQVIETPQATLSEAISLFGK